MSLSRTIFYFQNGSCRHSCFPLAVQLASFLSRGNIKTRLNDGIRTAKEQTAVYGDSRTNRGSPLSRFDGTPSLPMKL